LAQQAANGSNTDEDRLAIQEEIRVLMDEVNRIAQDTTFGGQNLLNGTYEAKFQVGADANQTIDFTMTEVGGATSIADEGGFTLSGIASIAATVVNGGSAIFTSANGFASGNTYDFSTVYTADGISVATQEDAQAVLAGMDSLIAVVDKKRAELGAVQNRFQSTIRNQGNVAENLEAAKSRIKDAYFAAETAKLTQAQILQQASQTILAQANQRPQAALQLLG
jgi:flagellin